MPLSNPALVYVPSPGTYSLNQQVKAPLLRADVAGAVQLLSNPPFFYGLNEVSPTAIPPLTDTPLTMDVENADPYNGHVISGTNNANYYGMQPGWYLAESFVPYNNTAGTGQCNAGIGVSHSGGAITAYYGQRLGISGTGGQFSMPICAKLVRFASVGTQAGTVNDYACALGRQSSAGTISTLSNSNKSAGLQLEWISALTGTPGLPVPSNDPWPVPPDIVTSAFLNKNSRDTINFLSFPPMMEAYNASTAQNINSATVFPALGTVVSLDTTFVDTWNQFGTASSTWTAPRNGLYYVYGNVGLTMGANGLSLSAGLNVTSPLYNGGTAFTFWGGAQAAVASMGNGAVVRRRLRLLAGDTVSLSAFQRDSSAAAAGVVTGLTAQSPCRLITAWRCF